MHKTVLFVRPNDPVAETLQQTIAGLITPVAEAAGLTTPFLVLRRFQSTAQPIEVASQVLMSVDPQLVRYLSPTAFKEPYQPLAIPASQDKVREWLGSDGTFVDDLYGWIGTPISAFTNKTPMFKVANCEDHGIVLVGSNKICMLWFMR